MFAWKNNEKQNTDHTSWMIMNLSSLEEQKNPLYKNGIADCKLFVKTFWQYLYFLFVCLFVFFFFLYFKNRLSVVGSRTFSIQV